MDKDTQARELWQEFVRALDAAVLLAFLTDDAEGTSPTYFKSLVPRINEAFMDCQAVFADPEGEFQPDPDVYLLELASELEDDAPPEEFAYGARALAAIAIHSALEAYVEALIERRLGSLPERLRDRLFRS